MIDTIQRSLHYRITDTDENEEKWKIKTYRDSGYTGDKDNCIYMFGCLVSWKSYGEKGVTLSLAEAKYIAISELCTEILLIKSILEFLNIKIKLLIIVHYDNIGAIYLGHN